MADGAWERYALQMLPRWLRGDWMDRLWLTLLHGPLDVADQAARDAVDCGLVERCPEDAVPYHARERQLEDVAGESVEALRTRTVEAWDFWSNIGNSVNLNQAINLYLGYAVSLWYFRLWVLGYTGGSSDDNNSDNWTRDFMVIELDDHAWTRPVIGSDLVVGPGLMVGITMTSSELSRIRRIYRKHRPGHMVGGDIYVLFDATPGASVAVVDHEASSDYARLPLHRQMVGYVTQGLTVGQHLAVGAEFV